MKYPIHTDNDGCAHAVLASQTKKKDVMHQKCMATGVLEIEEYET